MNRLILLIDDDPLMHLLYAQHFRRAGYELISATDSREGVIIAASRKPALVLLDMLLPDASGFATLHDLKSVPETKDIPVIVFSGGTGGSHHAARKEALSAGAKALLTKPVGPSDLLKEVARFAPVEEEEGSA